MTGSLADTPEPPYTAVIFTSVRNETDPDGYQRMSAEMGSLAAQQPGYLGQESARAQARSTEVEHAGVGVTVSYWRDDEAARAWKGVAEHLVAQRLGRERWYSAYRVRVATVTRDDGTLSPGERGEPDI